VPLISKVVVVVVILVSKVVVVVLCSGRSGRQKLGVNGYTG